MTHGSLFSGIGGFDLAAEWMGWSNLFHCEWNEFGQRVLGHYWPHAECFTDITQSDFTPYRDSIDVLTGCFPCQPYSAAGKRLGKADDRHLWPHMLRAIREISPRYVVGENVRGLVNWNGGLVFDEVQADLEAEGYEVQPFLLPACAVNAPHRRDRIWFCAFRDAAHSQSNRSTKQHAPTKAGQQVQTGRHTHRQTHQRDTPDTERVQRESERNSPGVGREREQITRYDFRNFPTVNPVCSGNDGLPGGLDGITFPKWRNESLKAYGNAIVPQVALQIFKSIEQYELQQLS
jgi:DNA (cytosine-5)-methyltransferase 1